MDVKYNTDTKIEDNSRAFKLQKANFDKEVNTAVRIELFFLNFDIQGEFICRKPRLSLPTNCRRLKSNKRYGTRRSRSR